MTDLPPESSPARAPFRNFGRRRGRGAIEAAQAVWRDRPSWIPVMRSFAAAAQPSHQSSRGSAATRAAPDLGQPFGRRIGRFTGGGTHIRQRVAPRMQVMQEGPLSSIVSAADDQEILPLARAGAGTVFPENIAAGLALADQVLLVCGFSQDNAANIVTTVRAELHPELRGRVGR